MKVNKKKVGAILMMAAGAGLIANAVYIKKKVEKYTQIIDQPEDNKESDISKSIKKAAEDKAVKIITFVVENQEKIEAITTVIGMAGTVIGIVNGIKEYKRSDEMEEMLKDICAFNDELSDAWNYYCKYRESLDNNFISRLDTIEKAVTKNKK